MTEITSRLSTALALVLVTSVLPNTATAQDDAWRTIEIETTEVTAPDVAITPDGKSLIFRGHQEHADHLARDQGRARVRSRGIAV